MYIVKILITLLIATLIIYVWGGFDRFRKLKTLKDFDKTAIKLVTNKKYKDAICLTKEMINHFQLDKEKKMELNIRIGTCYYMEGDFQEATKYYLKVTEFLRESEPPTINNSEPLINAVDSFIKCNRKKDASEIYYQLLKHKYSSKELEKLKQFALLHEL